MQWASLHHEGLEEHEEISAYCPRPNQNQEPLRRDPSPAAMNSNKVYATPRGNHPHSASFGLKGGIHGFLEERLLVG